MINQENAIEVQFSKISISKIIRRTTGLKRIGLNVIWIIKDVPLKINTLNYHHFKVLLFIQLIEH